MSQIESAVNDLFNGKSELSGMKEITIAASKYVESGDIDNITIKTGDYTMKMKMNKKGIGLSLKQQTEEIRQA